MSIYDEFDRPHHHDDPPHPLVAPVRPTGTVGTPYGTRALTDEARDVATAAPGTRNDRLNRAVFALAQLVAAGHLDPGHVHTTLTAAARAAGLTDREITATLDSGYRAGATHPRAVPDLPALPEPGTLHDTATLEQPADDQPADDPDEHTAALARWRASQLTAEVERLRTRRHAERLVTAEEAAEHWREPPYRATLTDELAIPDQPVTYLVDDVLPTGGNVLLTAQYKTGKTTLLNTLARSLADGEKFLGRFGTHHTGRIALWNYEMDDRQYRHWLRETGITNTDDITVLNLRGYRVPAAHPHIEDWIVAWLTTNHITCWLVDPFARAFIGSGTSENDNTEVGTFLDTLDVIKTRAGVNELVLPAHTGRAEMDKGTERARGATRLDDWADVRWLLTKDDRDTRYFRAEGRDVDVPEERLDYDEATRALTLGGGDRTWEKRRRLEDTVIAVVTEHPGIGVAALRAAVRAAGEKGRNDVIDAAIASAEFCHAIHVERAGTGSVSKHYPSRDITLVELP